MPMLASMSGRLTIGFYFLIDQLMTIDNNFGEFSIKHMLCPSLKKMIRQL